jgi:acyl-CoA thioesterase I
VQRFNTASILAAVCLLTTITVLSGCKADPAPAVASSNASVAVQPAKTPELDTRPVIVCFGDSLTAGYGADAGQSYPDHLQRLLDSEGKSFHVVNAGVSGETTKDGLERVNHVIGLHPQIVVLEFGGNDGLRGLPIEQTQSNIDAMIAQLQKSGTKVALAGITLPPDYGPDYIAKFNAMYPALAKKYHVPLLPFLLQDVYGTAGDMQADATHATTQGNKQVALNVEKLIAPMLKR